ncbi:hypothetical protein PBV87_05200 [Niameybacter massiliensis]|uniref:Uncharacterized protein n=1 Tax=Holtiella tumoricola TaxID=3018743 RepID=A0AA42DKV7_9FIRM|nr:MULTISPECIES: hypothetical protein [Lachnospirales]MDA3730896.1 hypothetical protein [Holtiella tumoricola]
MKQNLKFIGKVTAIHVITYILCGMFFSTIFNYEGLFELGNAKYFMRPAYGIGAVIGPLVQIVRGALFGCVLLLVKDSFIGKKYGALKLWAVLAIVGIINTPGPAPCSIEGIIYTQLPLEFHLKGAPEILIQTLLFSYFVTRTQKATKKSFVSDKYKTACLAMMITGIGFSLSGIVLALILKVDIMAGMEDKMAFGVMGIAMIIAFVATQWYVQNQNTFNKVIHLIICYSVLAILPTVYNYIVDSPFKSSLALVIGVIPTMIIGIVVYKRNKEVIS